MKQVTIPRLELCAAVLLAKLMTRVIFALKLNMNYVFFWSDSSIVLAWLKKEPCCMKTFVANRVAVVQEMTEVRQWHHVPSKQNPADLISRGADPVKLQLCELWWRGPPFLLQPVMTKCQDDIPEESEELYLRELKPPAVSEIYALINTYEPLNVINNCSSYNKLLRVVAWCKRFLHNTRHPLHATRGTLTTCELSLVRYCVLWKRSKYFICDRNPVLRKGCSIPNSSKVLNLCPFLDHDGILRVGGRLKNNDLSEMRKHPMILPTKHNFTVIVINHLHVLYFHAGAETTLSLIRSKFWIVSARNVIRKIVFNCMICKKVNCRSVQQQMADLPAARLIISKVFAKTGLDFCGPFVVKHFIGRSKQVCAATDG
ncbi:uncharacterized protein LOC118204843 [Stegodyphus dumicola]|uniref:uncharacterized protein LOC118204843 n=1 Tax=Stegodyphus dumicola TaxID=202533 RepID=UPI0015AB49D2|nr:uncharacterized protein LOC118204843 [Stegodyphus dumicola]